MILHVLGIIRLRIRIVGRIMMGLFLRVEGLIRRGEGMKVMIIYM